MSPVRTPASKPGADALDRIDAALDRLDVELEKLETIDHTCQEPHDDDRSPR